MLFANEVYPTFTIDESGFHKWVAQTLHRSPDEDPVVIIHRIHGELLAQEIEHQGLHFSCREGCSLCCHQVFVITNLEARTIKRFVLRTLKSSIRKIVTKRLAKQSKRFLAISTETIRMNRLTNLTTIATANPEVSFDGSISLEWKKVCPFLHNNKCAIYPVRPMDCRMSRSIQQCGENIAVKGHDLQLDRWAYDAITDLPGDDGRNLSILRRWKDTSIK